MLKRNEEKTLTIHMMLKEMVNLLMNHSDSNVCFIPVKEAEEDNTFGFKQITHQATISQLRDFTLFVLSSQSAAIFLGRLYCNKGGKSIMVATLVQFIGFPIF